MSQIQFVDGWTIVQTLGEGSFGEVKLLLHKNGKSAVAMKIIDLKNNSDALDMVRKEAAIHSRLRHTNIVRCFGHRHTTDVYYIFLEYVSGGELFDQIEPDLGMSQPKAKKYFNDLLAGVEYLHANGVAHRDLKPENLLLDPDGTLKISDFGLATMFLCGGRRRKLERNCGTLPYLAPEVLSNEPYQAEPSDIWSCGIILVSMLAGELPWDKPSIYNRDYNLWKTNDYANHSPWSKLDTLALSLVRKILNPTPSKRYDIQQIKSHHWLNMSSKNYGDKKLEIPFLLERSLDDTRSSFSQPTAATGSHDTSYEPEIHSFSQPTQIDNLLLSTQFMNSQLLSTPNNSIQKLVKRMTRFSLSLSPEQSLKTLSKFLEDFGYTWKMNSPGSVTITTTDQRLVFKCNLILMNNQTLMDFRLSKGCGLEFKRHFVSIRKAMSINITNV